MYINKTKAMAGVALLCGFSVLLQMLGTFISVNTLFFTALAAYLIGFSIHRYGLRYGGMQLAACTLLDVILNPDKFHWILYVCLGIYIFLSELIFCKGNRVQDIKKKMKVQLIYNWILFFQNLLFAGTLPGGITSSSLQGMAVLWLAGQVGWFLYDKAYRVFCQTLRERKI